MALLSKINFEVFTYKNEFKFQNLVFQLIFRLLLGFNLGFSYTCKKFRTSIDHPNHQFHFSFF